MEKEEFAKKLALNMEKLSDRLLMEAYCKALELELAKDFIIIIRKELERRRLYKIIQYS